MAMRVVVLGLIVALFPVAAGAQSNRPKAAATGSGVTKEEYIEQAKQRAAKRFDKLDTNHDGVLSPDERKTARRNKKSPQE
jgi:hypothetical protein